MAFLNNFHSHADSFKNLVKKLFIVLKQLRGLYDAARTIAPIVASGIRTVAPIIRTGIALL
jgi:hypothetical protein